MPGPVPKRSDQRRRRNKSEIPVEKVEVSGGPVEAPPPDSSWHPVATDWYVSLTQSGQTQFYEPSDWATARYVAEAMSRSLSSGRFSGQLFAAVMSAMDTLLTTEGARRRARIELERAAGAPVDDPKVTAINDYRRRLGA